MVRRGEWSPLVDVIDKKDKIMVKAGLPGVDKKDVKISLSENTLTDRGERRGTRSKKRELLLL